MVEAAPAHRHVRRVDVYLWGTHMGAVALDSSYGFYVFAYTEAFAATGISPAPLHMPVVANQPYIFTELPELTYKRLPGLLRDALPDDFGGALIDRYMADRGVVWRGVTEHYCSRPAHCGGARRTAALARVC